MSEIYIRADGGNEIGLGHLVRCISLAEMLSAKFNITFVSRQIPEPIKDDLNKSGFSLVTIAGDDEFFEVIKPGAIVVLDHYGLDTAFQKKLKDLNHKVVCIDDLHDKVFYADVIINTAPNVSFKDYSARLYTQFALGLDYVMLRKPFLLKSADENGMPKKDVLFICFGGADSKNITRQTLALVHNDPRFKKIIVVTGAAYIYERSLDEIISGNKKIEWHIAVGAEMMASLMMQSEYAIVPASGIMQEALAAGCKIISGMYVENQKFIFENYLKLGAFVSSGDFSAENLKNAIDKIFDTPHHKLKLVDGNSPQRLMAIFKQLLTESSVTLRAASAGYLPVTYEWAGNELIRKFSFNKEAISYDEHKKWFLGKLEDKSCFYYIGLLNGKPFGSIRFDVYNTAAKISYLIDPRFQNRSLGTILLKKGMIELSERLTGNISLIWGDVFKENIASRRIFTKLGYSVREEAVKEVLRFEKKIDEAVV